MTEQNSPTTPKPRLLLADDTKVVRVSGSRILSEDFDVVLAEHGEEAWDLVRSDASIQAVFTDLSMPYLDGFGLLERIRQADDERISVLPVIILTGDESDETRADALKRGATDFVTKPFNKIDLTARAKAHTANTRKARELAEVTTIDPVTRLGNKQFFLDKLRQDRAFTMRHGQALSLLRMDIGNIRDIAAQAGKEAALQLLKQVASVLRTTIREEDTAARIGTGQFATILPACDEEGAARIAARLQLVLNAANSRQAAKGQALNIAIAVTTPSEQPDADLDVILAALEKRIPQTIGSGIHIIAVPKPKSAVRKPAAADVGKPAITLEQALALVAAGKIKMVLPHLPALLKRVLPLLRLTNGKQRAVLKDYLDRDS